MPGIGRAVAAVALVVMCAAVCAVAQDMPACSALQMGQFECASPDIDPQTSSVSGCGPDRTVSVTCAAIEGVNCTGSRTYAISVPCRYTTGYEHRKALGYSVFLGLVGADRFYLGYPGIAVFKFMTCGFFFLGYYVDAILIGLQLLKPADGSDYAVRLNGPVYAPALLGDATYYVPLDDA